MGSGCKLECDQSASTGSVTYNALWPNKKKEKTEKKRERDAYSE